MTSAATILGQSFSENPLKLAFLKWQCRVRQIAMREEEGRPGAATMPSVLLSGDTQPLGHIITVLNRAPAHSVTAELLHMARKTNDPAIRRQQAIQFLSAEYYQRPQRFSDVLTATFQPESDGAARLLDKRECVLEFDAFAQDFRLWCKVWRLEANNSLYQATVAHNRLFNPSLPDNTIVLGFEPDWTRSSADPTPC